MQALLFCTMFSSCKNEIEKINFYTKRNLPSFEITNIETVFSDSGIVKVRIHAPELVRYDNVETPYDEYAHGLYVEFLDDSLHIVATLRCDYARYLSQSELWQAKYDVEVANNNTHEILNTELLNWSMREKRIFSDKFVRISTDDEIMTGTGFESNQDFSKWKIINPIGTIQVQDE